MAFARTTINMCKDYLKHWRRSRADIADYENRQNDNSFHIDETLKIVMELPTRYKDVIYLYYYEGYTSAKIAGLLKKPHFLGFVAITSIGIVRTLMLLVTQVVLHFRSVNISFSALKAVFIHSSSTVSLN